MMGVTFSPLLGLSSTKVLLLTKVLNSFLTDCNQAVLMGPSGILIMLRRVFRAGSHDIALAIDGKAELCTSVAQASCNSVSVHKFSQYTGDATEAYLGLGRRLRVPRRSGKVFRVQGLEQLGEANLPTRSQRYRRRRRDWSVPRRNRIRRCFCHHDPDPQGRGGRMV